MDLEMFSELAGGLDHPEGVAQGPDGRIYAGVEAGQIYRITLDGDVKELASTGGFIHGVTLDGTGNVYACDFGSAAVMRVSPTGEISTYSTGTSDRPLRVPNYAAFDTQGNLYVTDSGEWGADDGLIFRVAPSGETAVWTELAPRFPNGCCISMEGDSLLVIESHGRSISRFPIRDDGPPGITRAGRGSDRLPTRRDRARERREHDRGVLPAGSPVPDGPARRRRHPRRGSRRRDP